MRVSVNAAKSKEKKMNTKAFNYFITMMLIFLLFYSLPLFAAERTPSNCIEEGYTFKNSNIVLRPTTEEPEQQLYLLQNLASQNLMLTHTDKRFVVDLSWRAVLEQNRWSTIALDQNNFEISCSLINENQEIAVPCEQVLGICLFPKTRFALSSLGTYWPSQNKTLQGAISDARHKGIKVLRK